MINLLSNADNFFILLLLIDVCDGPILVSIV